MDQVNNISQKRNRESVIWHYRWMIGLAIFVIAVLFSLNGSSIGSWDKYARDASKTGDAVLLGESREVRSDEWCVFTPMSLSQYYNHFGRTSDILRATDTDVYIVYGQCVKDWSVVFRPFQIGYLFLDPGRGLSFYWCGRLIALFLVSLEFGMLITGRKRYYSIAYALMVTFAPAIQWWYCAVSFPDMLVYGQGLVLCLNGYLKTSSYRKRMLYAAVMTWLEGAYLLVLYPAWQIPFFYIFLLTGLWVIISNKSAAFHWKKDIPIALASIAILGICMGLIISRSWDTIQKVMNSAYPGHRLETGGGGGALLFRYLGNLFFPYTDLNVPGNVCESSAFYDLFPLGILLSLYILLKKKRDVLTMCLLGATLALGIFVVAGFPSLLSQLTLLSQSPVKRCVVALSYANMLLVFRSVALSDIGSKISQKWYILPAIGLLALGVAWTANACLYRIYFTPAIGILCALALVCAYLSIWHDKSFCLIMCILCFIMGATVNPVRMGVRDITEENSLAQAITEITREDGKSRWMTISDVWVMGNYPIMFGAPTINSTNTYINEDLWNILDPEGTYREIYNRYAHIRVNLTLEREIKIEQPFGDQILLTIPPEMLSQLGVTYLLSSQDLEMYQTDRIRFERIFSKEGVDYSIYRVDQR